MISRCKTTFTRLILVSTVIATSSACTSLTDKNEASTKTKQLAKTLSKPPSSFGDTLSINPMAAVFYNPDSVQREKIKAANTKEIFESMSHEFFFQMNNAKLLIRRDWPEIKIIECSQARYLLFEKKDGTSKCIDLNTRDDMSGIILFDGQKDPEFADMMNIDTDLGFYFKN